MKIDEYIRVKTKEEVTDLLHKYGEQAAIIAGGTIFHELVERDMVPNVKKIIDIEQLDLNYINSDKNALAIGTLTKLRNINEHSFLNQNGAYKAMVDATKILPIQVQGIGTIGGNICAGLPLLSVPPVMLVFDAELKITSYASERVVPITEFFIDYFVTNLRADELLTEITIPNFMERTGSAFEAYKALTVDFPTVSVAVKVTIGSNNNCEDIKIAFGSAGRIPIRSKIIEKRLKGKKLESKLIEEAVESVVKEIEPTSDIRGSAEYKKNLAKILTKNTILKAVSRANG